MIKGSKLREIANRYKFNLYDEQIRTIFELIQESAEEGNLSFSFNSMNLKDNGLSYDFWFESARLNTETWQKVNKLMVDNEYTISYVINNYPDQTITIFW